MSKMQSSAWLILIIASSLLISCNNVIPEFEQSRQEIRPARIMDKEVKETPVYTDKKKPCNQTHLFQPMSLDKVIQTKKDVVESTKPTTHNENAFSGHPSSDSPQTAVSFNKNTLEEWLWNNVRSRLIRNLWTDPNDHRQLKLMMVESAKNGKLSLLVKLSWQDRWTKEKLSVEGRLLMDEKDPDLASFTILQRNHKAREFEQFGNIKMPDQLDLWLKS